VDQTPTAFSILRHPLFSRFVLSRVSSTLASQSLAVAVGWQIYALSNSTFYLGLVGLAQFLPMFLLTLVVGQVADRSDRRKIARACQLIEAAAIGLLVAATVGGFITPGMILAAVSLFGAARAFEMPSMQALLPGLVGPAIFPRATAWSTSAAQTAAIIGPALGGALYVAGPTVAYLASALLLVCAAILISTIRLEREPPKRQPATLRSALAGLAFIRRRPAILGAISLDLFAVLFGGATALLPAYARDILAVGPWALGLLRSAPSVGAVAMSVFLAHRPLRRRVGRTMLIAVAIFGLATILFAVSRSFALSLGALIVLGAADVISMVIRSSLVQLRTPDEMRGRVSAVNSLFVGTSNQLGEFESGITASWFGLVPAVIIGGAGTLLVVLVWSRLFPALRRADRLEDETERREAQSGPRG
jgi:MFS family permease